MEIDEFYLPINSVQTVYIGSLVIDCEVEQEQMASFVGRTVRAFRDNGFHADAINFGCEVCRGVVNFYKEVPLLDVYKHLENN
jgi:hypothetical protein